MRILKEKKVKGLWKNLENKKKREAIRKLKMKKKRPRQPVLRRWAPCRCAGRGRRSRRACRCGSGSRAPWPNASRWRRPLSRAGPARTAECPSCAWRAAPHVLRRPCRSPPQKTQLNPVIFGWTLNNHDNEFKAILTLWKNGKINQIWLQSLAWLDQNEISHSKQYLSFYKLDRNRKEPSIIKIRL